MFPSDKKHGAKRSIIPEKIILQQSNVSSGPALVDILDKLIRMDVVAKEAPINDENDVSHGRKLPTVPPAFPSAAFSPVLHILLSYSSSFHSFPSFIMFPAKRHITLVRSKENLRAFPNDFSVCVSRIALRPSSAPATVGTSSMMSAISINLLEPGNRCVWKSARRP